MTRITFTRMETATYVVEADLPEPARTEYAAGQSFTTMSDAAKEAVRVWLEDAVQFPIHFTVDTGVIREVYTTRQPATITIVEAEGLLGPVEL